MKKLLLGSLLCAVLSVGHAQRIGWEPIPIPGSSGYGSSNHSSRNNDEQGGYRGSSGARYQYDLNNPADQIRYSTDLSAQRRDQIQGTLDSGRTLDHMQGQRGGGYLGN